MLDEVYARLEAVQSLASCAKRQVDPDAGREKGRSTKVSAGLEDDSKGDVFFGGGLVWGG